MSLDSWARLHTRWYLDPMIRACAKRHPETLAVWPVLIALAKDSSSPENLHGEIEILLDDLAYYIALDCKMVMSVLNVLQDAGLLLLDVNKLDCYTIKIVQFSKYQTAKRTKRDRDQRYREAFAGKKPKKTTVTRRSRDALTAIDRDRDRDVDNKNPSIVAISETEKNLSAMPEPDGSSSTTASVDNAKFLFEYWLAKTGRSHQQYRLTKSRRAKVNGRLSDGYTIEQLKQAIDGIAQSSWHSGDNPNSKRYDTFDFIFRSGENIEKGIDYLASKPKSVNDQTSKDIEATRKLYVEMGLDETQITELLKQKQAGSIV